MPRISVIGQVHAGTEKEEKGGGLCEGVDGDGNAPAFPFRTGQPLQ